MSEHLIPEGDFIFRWTAFIKQNFQHGHPLWVWLADNMTQDQLERLQTAYFNSLREEIYEHP